MISRLRYILFLIAFPFAVSSCFAQQRSADINGTDIHSADHSFEKDILNYINEYRVSKGLSALVMNDVISAEAEKHSMNMAENKVAFSHDGFEDRVKRIVEKSGFVHASAENVAYGKLSPKEVVNVWLKSPGHKKNIEGNYTYTGIGVAKNADGIIYFTQIFTRK